MKKSVRSLIMCLASVLGIGAFATACGESSAFGDENEHVHTYSDDWTADAEGHFHDYTCDCTDMPKKEEHVDDNNDGVCDLCKFTDHEHTYAEDWTVDCTNHWHAADCGHIVAGVDLAEHVDENADGECDVCKYVIEDIHEHVYSPDWTSDDEYHWHAALCEHKDQVSGHEAHQLNEAGDCTVCKEHVKDVDLTNLEKVLAAAMANNYKIAYGDVIAVDTVYDGVGKQTVMSGKTNKVHFALGNGQSYIQYVSFDKEGVFNGVEEQWFERQENGEVYGVKKAYGEYELEPAAGDEQFLNGYNYIPGSILPSDSDDTTTLANTLMALYNQMKAGIRVSNATENYDPATGKYSFAYTYYSVNTTTVSGEFYSIELELYNVAVEFTVNADMIIDAADFSVEVYRDYENDSDLDYTYDVAYDEAGNCIVTIISDVTLKASANPSTYEYSVAQVSGERTFTTPYPRESLIPTSFEFSYVTKYEFPDAFDFQLLEEVPIEDTLTLPTGTYAYFHIGDILPKTASSKFLVAEDFTYSFVNNDPNSTGRAWYDSDSIINGYSAYISCLKLKLRDVGEYTVTIAFGDIQKTFTLIVEGEKEPELPEDDKNTVNVATTDTYAWEDEYSYTATESGTYTFNLPAGLGFWSVDAQQPEMDFYNNANGDSVSFDLAAGQKLTFNVGATTKGTWVITVDFVAGEVEGGGDVGGDVVELTEKDLVIGNNSNNAADVKYVYTAETAGTLTIKYGGFVMGSNSSITYVVNDGTATTLEAGVMAELVLAAGDVVAVNVYANGGYATVVTTWTADESGDVGETTEETALVMGNNAINAADVTYAYTATEAGTLTLEVGGAVMGMVEMSYTVNGGTSTVLELSNTVDLELSEGDKVVITVIAEGYSSITASWAGEAGGSEGGTGSDGTQGSGTADDRWVITELPYTVTFEDTHDVYYTYTATEDCTLYFECPTGCLISEIGATKDDLGNYSLSVTAGQVVQFNPWSNGGTAPYTYTISKVEESNGSDGTQGSGTAADRWVITELPYTVTFEDTHDVYYTYTATEDCTLYFECPTGCLISELGATKDDLGNYSLSVTAGQVVQFNPWSNGGTAPYTYTISKVEVQTPDPEQPGEGGGEVDGDVVTLVSDVAANGKMITLTIDKVNETMSITRSNSDGSSASTAVYTYTFDDAGTFTGVKQSGNICTFVWGDNGIPTTVTWNGVAFTNFK